MMAILFLSLVIGCLAIDPFSVLREDCGIADFINCIERDSIRWCIEEGVIRR